MGRSLLLGNSGYIGTDKRNESSSTGTTGNVSVKKHFLERQGGFFPPIEGGSTTGILYQEDWDDFVGGDWFQISDTTNNWLVSNADAATGSFAGLVVLTSDSSYTYLDNQDVHLWVDVYIPPEVTDISLDFNWKCNGESQYDYGYVWITNTGDTLTAVDRSSAADRAKRLGGDTSVGSTLTYYRRYNDTYNGAADTTWVAEPTMLLTSGGTQSTTTFDGGTHNRFVFSFHSDTSINNNPPFGVDDIVWSYTASTAITVNPNDPNS